MRSRYLTVLIGMAILAVLIGIDSYYHRTTLKFLELFIVLINVVLGIFYLGKSK